MLPSRLLEKDIIFYSCESSRYYPSRIGLMLPILTIFLFHGTEISIRTVTHKLTASNFNETKSHLLSCLLKIDFFFPSMYKLRSNQAPVSGSVKAWHGLEMNVSHNHKVRYNEKAASCLAYVIWGRNCLTIQYRRLTAIETSKGVTQM